MIWSAQRLKQSCKLFPQVLTNVATALIPLSIGLWLMEYFVSQAHQNRFSSSQDTPITIIISMGLGAFILESLISVAWLILATKATKDVLEKVKPQGFVFLQKHFHQTLIEYVRAMISVGLYSLILIIPGIFRWLQLTFTCYISLFNEQYHQGKVDALQRSAELTQGKKLSLLFLLILFALIPMMLEKLAWSWGAFSIPLVFFYALSWLATLLVAIYMTLTYFALAKSKRA